MIGKRDRKEEDSLVRRSNDKEGKEPTKKTIILQQNQLQKSGNKDNSSKNIYYGVGLISLILVVASAMVV